MPYSTVDELPEAVRKVLTPDAQALFLAALNDALQDGNPGEPFAMSRAWSAVGRQYQVLPDGTFGAVTKNAVFTDRAPLIMVEHDSILQTLDRESNGVYLGKEFFEPTVDAWNEVPLIYAQEHPDLDAWDKDSEAELKRIKGRLIKGSASGTHIELTGHPRLMTALKLQDKEIEKGIRDGKISTSNGFRTRVKDGKLAGDVTPHHILFFDEKPEGPVPGDKGVIILNTQSRKAEGLRLTDRLRALFQGAGDPPEPTNTEEDDMTDKELETKLADARKEAADAKLALTQLQADVAAKDQEIAALKAKTSELETEKQTFVQKAKDDKWGAFKAKHVPPGMVADAAKEKETREAFERDPLTFLEKLLERKPNATGEEGLEFQQSGERKAPRVGRYDPSTGKWE